MAIGRIDPASARPAPVMRLSAESAELAIKYRQLTSEGMRDWQIARKLAAELGKTAKSVNSRIQWLRAKGFLEENPHRQPKRRFDRKELMEERARMMACGMCDGTIAHAIAAKAGKTFGTVNTTIYEMVRRGLIPKNPHNRKETTPDELKTIIRRRTELAALGLTDAAIARVLSDEAGGRGPPVMRLMVWRFVKGGLLPENDSDAEDSRALESLMNERKRLMEQGMDDKTIARLLAEAMNLSHKSIEVLIHRIVTIGKCRKNPNAFFENE